MRTLKLAGAAGLACLLAAQGAVAGLKPIYAHESKQTTGADSELAQELALSVGVSVEALEALAAELQATTPEQFWGIDTKPVPDSATDEVVFGGGYDKGLRSLNTPRQQAAVNAERADELYRYSLNIRDLPKRKRVLQEAARLGSIKAQDDLRHY